MRSNVFFAFGAAAWLVATNFAFAEELPSSNSTTANSAATSSGNPMADPVPTLKGEDTSHAWRRNDRDGKSSGGRGERSSMNRSGSGTGSSDGSGSGGGGSDGGGGDSDGGGSDD